MKKMIIPESVQDTVKMLRYKLIFYSFLSTGAIILELIGISLSGLFIYLNLINLQNPQLFYYINKNFSQINLVLIGYLAFGLSIVLIICNSSNIRRKVALIQDCLARFKDGSPDIIRNIALSRAEKLLTDADRGRFIIGQESNNEADVKHTNLPQSAKERMRISKVDPLTRRQILREDIILLGIFIMSVTFIITLITNISVPNIIIIQALLLYILIMCEYISYKFIMKKSNVNIFSENHRVLISRKSNRKENAVAIKKILIMRKDRYNNYQKTLSIIISTANFFAIFLTLLDISGSEALKHRFRLPDSYTNTRISLYLSIFSLVLYIFSLGLSKILNRHVDKIDDYINLDPNTKTYLEILVSFVGPICTKSIFLGKDLDISRGLHEYNVEVLNLNYNEHFKIDDEESKLRREIADNHVIRIAIEDSFRVKHRITNNIPRINLTVFIFGTVEFCAFVWGHPTPLNLFILFISMVILFFVLCAIVKRYVSHVDRNWDLFITNFEHNNLKQDIHN